MKIPKTLFFMVLNPIPLIVHLTWWFLFAALSIVFDDPFIEGRGRHIAQIVSPPSSFGNYVRAASIIFDEIIKEFTSGGGVYSFIFVMLPAFTISYREARGNLQGIAREHTAWMHWYRQQQENIFEESPPALEDRKVNSYFRKTLRTLRSMIRNPVLFIVHFAYWFSAFTLVFAVLFALTEWAGIVDTVREFVKMLPEFALLPLVLALLSSYQETRGTVKGIIKVRQMWTEWYHQRQSAKVQETIFDVSPPLFDTSL